MSFCPDWVVSFRRELHANPELSMREHGTKKRIIEKLESFGVDFVERGETGLTATIGKDNKGKHIAFRCDMDALPMKEENRLPHASKNEGVMHACGHDGHTACLVAVAEQLNKRESELPGPVTLIFQPAEEDLDGAAMMIKAGALDGVDEIYAWHNQPKIRMGLGLCINGTTMAGVAIFKVHFHGVGGHASQPERVADPIQAGAMFVGMCNAHASRRTAPQGAVTVAPTGFHSGTASNITPETAEVYGTIRFLEMSQNDGIQEWMRRDLEAVKLHTGVNYTLEYIPVMRPTINHDDKAELARKAILRVFGEGNLTDKGLPSMGGEDFAEMLENRPGALAIFGTGHTENSSPLHSPHYDFADEVLEKAIRWHLAVIEESHNFRFSDSI